MLNEMVLVSKTLQDLIVSSTSRKIKLDDLISLMNPKVFEGHAARKDIDKDASEDNAKENGEMMNKRGYKYVSFL